MPGPLSHVGDVVTAGSIVTRYALGNNRCDQLALGSTSGLSIPLDSTMTPTRHNRSTCRVALTTVFLCTGLAALPACEEQTPAPAAGTGGGGTNTGGTSSGGQTNSGNGALSGLREDPTTLLGKSAKSGKNVAGSIEDAQAQAVGAADEISGAATVTEVAGIRFPVPSSWQKGTSGGMRAATFTVDAGEGNADVVFFHFGTAGQGGTVQQNIDRWQARVKDETGQPAEMRVSRHKVGGMNVTIVKMEGAYNAAMPGAGGEPDWKANYGFRGAIVEGTGGAVFIRMTGPEAAVHAADAEFEGMVLGAGK